MRKLKIRISKSKIRNNIKILIFKIQNNTKPRPMSFRFGHLYLLTWICFEFRYSNFEFPCLWEMGQIWTSISEFYFAIFENKTFETWHQWQKQNRIHNIRYAYCLDHCSFCHCVLFRISSFVLRIYSRFTSVGNSRLSRTWPWAPGFINCTEGYLFPQAHSPPLRKLS